MAQDYVDIEIDIDRMKKGKSLEKGFRLGKGGGIPWYAIVEPNGTVLATADGPGGNVGCPASAEEITHFMATLRKTRRHASPVDFDAVEEALVANGRRLLGR